MQFKFHKLLKSMTNHSFLCSSLYNEKFPSLGLLPSHLLLSVHLIQDDRPSFCLHFFFLSHKILFFNHCFWLLPTLRLISNNVTASFLCTNFSVPHSDSSPTWLVISRRTLGCYLFLSLCPRWECLSTVFTHMVAWLFIEFLNLKLSPSRLSCPYPILLALKMVASTPETNIMLYVNYSSKKKVTKLGWSLLFFIIFMYLFGCGGS